MSGITYFRQLLSFFFTLFSTRKDKLIIHKNKEVKKMLDFIINKTINGVLVYDIYLIPKELDRIKLNMSLEFDSKDLLYSYSTPVTQSAAISNFDEIKKQILNHVIMDYEDSIQYYSMILNEVKNFIGAHNFGAKQ